MKAENRILASNIHRIRQQRGETLEQFGERFDPVASKSIVSKWESGETQPSPPRLKQLASMANVSVEDLLNLDLGIEGKKWAFERFRLLGELLNESLNKESLEKISEEDKILLGTVIAFTHNYPNLSGSLAIILQKINEQKMPATEETNSKNIKAFLMKRFEILLDKALK